MHEAVGLGRISGIGVLIGPLKPLAKVPAIFMTVAEELPVLAAADCTSLIVFDALDFSGFLAFSTLPPFRRPLSESDDGKE